MPFNGKAFIERETLKGTITMAIAIHLTQNGHLLDLDLCKVIFTFYGDASPFDHRLGTCCFAFSQAP